LHGYTGKTLFIDLSKKQWRVEELKEGLARRFIGGKGFGAYYLLELARVDADLLAPEQPFIMAAGPLNGTRVPMTSKVAFVFRSPLTGGYGESFVGGSLPKYPKWVGYDVVIIVGRSEKPVYILFTEDGIEFRDARDLWGMKVDEADEALRREHGQKASIATIGPAGENKVYFASICVDKWRQAGRCGGGAVMGSKNLKALVFVSGDNWIEPANPGELEDLIKGLIDARNKTPGIQRMHEYGTSAMVALANEMGFFPTYYWSQGRFERWENIGPEAVKSILQRTYACWNCFIACGRYVSVQTKWGKIEMDGPEYETIFALGGLFGIDDLGELVYLNYLADAYGLDTITLGNVLGFAAEASKRGKLSLEISYGDVEKAIQLIEDITYRRGIGDLLANGVAKAAKKLGLENIAVHVRGLEPPGYDPRTLKGMALAYATSQRGACHLRMMAYYVDIKGLAGPPNDLSRRKIAKLVEFEDFMTGFDSLILCKFSRDIMSLELMWKLYNTVTGFNISYENFRNALKEIVSLARNFNEKTGLSKDYLPERFFKEPIKIGTEERRLSKEEFKHALNTYYELREL